MKRCLIIYAGSNDGYHSDYLQRTSFALNHTLARLGELASSEFAFSIVFVDLIGKRPPLAEVLSIHRNNIPHLTFLEVRRDLSSNEFGSNSRFPISHLQNIAMRHVDADYFVHGASDLIGSLRFWRDFSNTILKEPDEGRLLFVPRCYLPLEFLNSNPSPSELEYLMDEVPLPAERISRAHGHAGYIGGSKTHFLAMRGFNEAFTGYGNSDTESFLYASGFSTPKIISSDSLKAFKIPYSLNGSRPSRSQAPAQPMHLSGYRSDDWGKPPGVLATRAPALLTDSLPSFPFIEFTAPRKMTTFYWLVSILRHLRGVRDILRAAAVKRAMRGHEGFAIAVQGLGVAELLTLCFWRRFSIILCCLPAGKVFDFVHFLYKLDRYLSTTDRLNVFRGVFIPLCLNTPDCCSASHAHSRLFVEHEVLVMCRSGEKLYVGKLSHSRLLAAIRSDSLTLVLSEFV